MTIGVMPVSNALGAEVSGLDLREPISNADVQTIRAAWLEHGILIFHDQPLSHAQHIAFSRTLGKLDDHESILTRDKDYHEILPITNPVRAGKRRPVGQQWHSDLSTTLYPAMGSLLRCEALPPVGGDTMWANMYAAYEALSPAMRSMLDDLEAVHDMTLARHHAVEGDPAEIAEVRRRNPPVLQPVVRTHPETGRKALYVAEMTTARIAGMSERESSAILNFLFEFSTQPLFTYRHRWREHDLIIWDNRCTMHLALSDYDLDVPRLMYRTTLLGEQCGRYASQ